MAPVQAELPFRRDFSATQLKLIRRTVARSCSDAEFDEFAAVAAQCGLDPLRRQITPLVLNPNDPERRRLIPWATIDGLRVIAARQGDYRPMETAPKLEFDVERVDPDRNPLGLVRAEVCAWKHRDGSWFPAVGEAWWDEYAPLREERLSDEGGAVRSTNKLVLEPNWARMGRVMIAKCAEAQALRRGWPDLLSGLYGEEELHALKTADKTATERLDDALGVSRGHGGRQAAWFVFDPEEGPVAVHRSDIASRIGSFLSAARSSQAIVSFLDRNRLSMSLFWEWEPTVAIEAKLLTERRIAELEASSSKPKRTSKRPAGKRRAARAPRNTEAAHEGATSPKA